LVVTQRVVGQPIDPIVRWNRQVVPKRRQEITTTGCVMTQKIADILTVDCLKAFMVAHKTHLATQHSTFHVVLNSFWTAFAWTSR